MSAAEEVWHDRTVANVVRMSSSKAGNPRFRLNFTDGTNTCTRVDSMISYAVSDNWNYRPVGVRFDDRGGLLDIRDGWSGQSPGRNRNGTRRT